jgi:hypothetical protein
MDKIKSKLKIFMSSHFHELIRIVFNTTLISDKTIHSVKSRAGWTGNGSKHEPIVIDNLSNLSPNILIKHSTLFYLLKDVNVNKLTCSCTQNITIENCKFRSLKLKGCYDLIIVNNTILKVKIIHSKQNSFINNKISQIRKKHQKNNEFKINPLYTQFRNPLMCLLYFLAISAFIGGTYLWYTGFIPLALIIFINFKNFYMNKRVRDKKDNLYVNNIRLHDEIDFKK